MEEKQKIAFDASGMDELISWEELKKKQYFVIPCSDEIKDQPPGLSPFARRSEEQPADHARPVSWSTPPAPSRSTSPTTPSVRRCLTGSRRATFTTSASPASAPWKYPLLCMSNHPHWRMHAQADDITWSREVPTMKVKGSDGYLYEPCGSIRATAEACGIEHGDIVKVFNERGIVLCGAYVTERLMPGVAYMDHGARWDPIIPGELDRGGAINTITPHNVTSKNCHRHGGERVPGRGAEGHRRGDGRLAPGLSRGVQPDYDLATGVSLSGWLMSWRETGGVTAGRQAAFEVLRWVGATIAPPPSSCAAERHPTRRHSAVPPRTARCRSAAETPAPGSPGSRPSARPPCRPRL